MYEKKLYAVSSAALLYSADSSPSEAQRDHTSAPTSDHEDEAVEQFYKQHDSIIAKTPTKDVLIVVQGDWNAQVKSMMLTNVNTGQEQ